MVIRVAQLVLLAAIAPAPVVVAPVVATEPVATMAGPMWVGTWEAAQEAPRTTGLSHAGFTGETVRDIVHISAGGSQIRIRVSNVFGTRPLRIGDVRVALSRTGARTVPGTSHRVMFGGRYRVTIPAGARRFSDAVRMRVGAAQELAVSMFVDGASGPASWHPAALASSYYSKAGDYAASANGLAYPHRMTAWYFLDGVDVVNPALNGAVVAFGASTSDGVGSTFGANERYTDDLASRLLALPAGLRLSVLNAGIPGNQLLAAAARAGQSGVARFYRDALAQSDVRVIIVWEGTNDIGRRPAITARQLISGYQKLIAAAHARGVAVVGATLQPDEGSTYYTAHGNRVRQEVNRWIRTSGAFDSVADFDKVLRDPLDPARLLPEYDSGDHLHPNDAGYLAIADTISPWALAGLAVVGPVDRSSPSRRSLGGAESKHRVILESDHFSGKHQAHAKAVGRGVPHVSAATDDTLAHLFRWVLFILRKAITGPASTNVRQVAIGRDSAVTLTFSAQFATSGGGRWGSIVRKARIFPRPSRARVMLGRVKSGRTELTLVTLIRRVPTRT